MTESETRFTVEPQPGRWDTKLGRIVTALEDAAYQRGRAEATAAAEQRLVRPCREDEAYAAGQLAGYEDGSDNDSVSREPVTEAGRHLRRELRAWGLSMGTMQAAEETVLAIEAEATAAARVSVPRSPQTGVAARAERQRLSAHRAPSRNPPSNGGKNRRASSGASNSASATESRSRCSSVEPQRVPPVTEPEAE